METNEKKANNKKIFIGAIIALLLLNGVTGYLLFSEKDQRVTVTSQKTALETEFRNLSDSLDYKVAELEQFRGKTVELDKAITAQQEQIQLQKKEISDLLAKGKLTRNELAKARKMIAEYEANIAAMTKQVEELTAENTTLTATNTQLNTDLTAERTTTSTLTEQNKGLAKKVEVGSLLKLANVEVEAIKRRNNGKEVEVGKAKAAESLKISFETGENKVVGPGNMSLYVRVINPKGETIAVADQGSGQIQSATNNESVTYSKKADFDYNQTNKKVVVYWSQNITTPGTYKVEVYQNGYVVGQGAVKLG